MARFWTAALDDGETRWACVDDLALGADSALSETRFGAYLKPFTVEDDAKRALLDAGAMVDPISEEQRSRLRRGR